MAPLHLPPALLAMVDKGVSTIVGSRDAALRPSVMRAVGSRLHADTGEITVYLARRQSRQVIQDIAATGHIAVVFSQPSTHLTVQLKASRATLRQAGPEDEEVLARYLAAMEAELTQIALPVELTRAMLRHQIEDVVAVRFMPEQAFDQTPGPRAGAALGGVP